MHDLYGHDMYGRKVHYGQRPSEEIALLNEKIVRSAQNFDIFSGERVLVGEGTLFKNDKDTPWHSLLRPGTVVRRYGMLPYSVGEDLELGAYPDLLDIEMDEVRPTGDRRHDGVFTYAVVRLHRGQRQ